ncbi:CBS domain-containing protein [Mariniflexile maritimum]|jgi:CBS domain-containing protein|uniref:CBS domain-containing protein n=1 Tax=Mariniflexile maritimum TaxID=2682493 RepID=UPI0012F665A0|nr:CBS domain-containing protein [Mariniflexile maritimum]MCB0449997.1 CBS domain-containing protein [Confluentibacter sp.]HMQ43201.1 CBS domain-containing protein [Mariniflexile sp.]HMR16102.1 CBS domain-containing protein [Mariniflexile sp.]
MRKITPISAIMTKNIIALTRSDNLEYAEKLFKKHKIRHIPVVSAENVIGMLSYSDLLRISLSDLNDDEQSVDSIVYNMFTIEQVMTKNVISVSSKTTIKEAAEIIAKQEFHALPIVDDGVLIGIVTTTDLLNYFIRQY